MRKLEVGQELSVEELGAEILKKGYKEALVKACMKIARQYPDALEQLKIWAVYPSQRMRLDAKETFKDYFLFEPATSFERQCSCLKHDHRNSRFTEPGLTKGLPQVDW